MVAILLGYQALIREIINGFAFMQCLVLVLMITIFLWDTWAAEGPMSYDRWSHFPGVRTACCLWWLFSAESYRTCNVWLSYNIGRIDGSASLGQSLGVGIFSASSLGSTVGYLTAGLVLNVALLRAIYIWTPPDWRARVWLYSVAASSIFVSIPIAITYRG